MNIWCSGKRQINGTYQGWSYIIRLMKIARQMMHNIRHIQSTQITTEQYCREQIKRGLEGQRTFSWRQDHLSRTGSFTHIQHIQTYTFHNDSWEESRQSTPIQHSPKTDFRHIVSDSKLDCATRSDTPQNMIMKNG